MTQGTRLKYWHQMRPIKGNLPHAQRRNTGPLCNHSTILASPAPSANLPKEYQMGIVLAMRTHLISNRPSIAELKLTAGLIAQKSY